MNPFSSPLNIIFGAGSSSSLLDTIQEFKVKKAILFADPGIVKAGLTVKVEESLRNQGIAYEIYQNIVPEPPLDTGNEAVEAVRNSKADIVIGIGGGSALDLAKAAAVIAENEGSISDYLNLTGGRKLTNKGLPKILIPTTAGTGSEVTDIAVFSLDTSKDVITHHFLMADTAIIDPELTYSLPARITAATGIDALTHAVEAYVSVNSNLLTDTLSLKAIELISQNIRKAVLDGNDREARENMAWGSVLAGLSFYNAGVSGVHALAYPLGGLFHIPHGESNAVMLPYVFDYIWQSCTEKVAKIAGAMGETIEHLTVSESAERGVKAMREIVNDVGLPSTLDTFGITAMDINQLADDAYRQKRLLGRSPKPYTLEAIKKIYSTALSENSRTKR